MNANEVAGPAAGGFPRGHLTQWAAQFAVASELCKRGYEVSLTMGNARSTDLMVTSPLGRTFLIQVKGLYKRNPWQVKPEQDRRGLFYVFAFVSTGGPNRFFVMSQTQKENYRKEELERLGRTEQYPRQGITWGQTLRHEDAWDVLPK